METGYIRLTDEIIENMNREEIINHLQIAKRCMISVEKIQIEYENINKQIKEVEEKRKDIVAGNINGFIFKGALCLLGALMALLGLGDGEFFYILAGIVIFIFGFKSFKKEIEIYKNKKEERQMKSEKYFNENNPPLLQKKADIENETRRIVESLEFKNSKFMVPEDYFDPDSVSSLIQILQNRRAKTLSDAINTFEADLHNLKMEYAATRSAVAAERQADKAEDIAHNTKSTARAAKLNAFINFIK